MADRGGRPRLRRVAGRDDTAVGRRRLRSGGHESEHRDRLHAAGSPAVLWTARRRADADRGDGKAATADGDQHPERFAGSADAELVHLRSEARRAVPGHVYDHGRARRHTSAGRQEITMPPDAGEPRTQLRPPSLGLMLAEVRGILEFNASLLLSPLLMRAPRGDGHPVLALPGFLASDLSMAPLRRYLGELGYDAHAWEM